MKIIIDLHPSEYGIIQSFYERDDGKQISLDWADISYADDLYHSAKFYSDFFGFPIEVRSSNNESGC